MTPVEIVFVAIFGVWGVLSVMCQFSIWRSFRFKDFDYFSLIPYWTFFAPNPSVSDYRLFYVLYGEKGKSGYVEVNYFLTKPSLSWLWNPYKRVNKFLFDTMQSLIQLVGEIDVKDLSRTLPYQILLQFLLDATEDRDGYGEVQFLIVETYGIGSPKKPKLIYSSQIHAFG